MRKSLVMFVAVWSGSAASVAAQHVESTSVLGTFTGSGSPQLPSGVELFGTDLGWAFEHRGSVQIFFGDTIARADSLCSVLTEGYPEHNDAQGTLPRQYEGGVPAVTFATHPANQAEFAVSEVFRDSVLLRSGENATPMTAFSDGEHALGLFQSTTFVSCTPAADGGAGSCPAPFVCKARVGQCQPAPLGVPTNCDLDSSFSGCVPDQQTCEPVGSGFCVDESSSLRDPRTRVALELELSVQRPDDPTRFDSLYTFRSNKFINPTARTIQKLAAGKSDYRPGHNTLLLWGRPAFNSDLLNNAQLYLLTHELPLEVGADGKIDFHPRYFAGLDRRGQPVWSDAQEHAAPLALDGRKHGSPREVLPVPQQLSITWLDAPIRRWVMFDGGGAPYNQDGPSTRSHAGVPDGAIVVRYADDPWGPWSRPETLLAAGDPKTPGTPYGPGGFVYHPDCVDVGDQQCARTDPLRYTSLLQNTCDPQQHEADYGALYAPSIIEPYNTRLRDGWAVHWTVSTWNPYRTMFVETKIVNK